MLLREDQHKPINYLYVKVLTTMMYFNTSDELEIEVLVVNLPTLMKMTYFVLSLHSICFGYCDRWTEINLAVMLRLYWGPPKENTILFAQTIYVTSFGLRNGCYVTVIE